MKDEKKDVVETKVEQRNLDVVLADTTSVSTDTALMSTDTKDVSIGTVAEVARITKTEAHILAEHHRWLKETFPKPKGDRTLMDAKSLDEFKPMYWIPIDFEPDLLRMRRTYNPMFPSPDGIEDNFFEEHEDLTYI